MKEIHEKSKLLAIILQNSGRDSDRTTAKKTGVSQPTITRFRRDLTKAGIIKGYRVIPDFNKIGYPIFAILQIGYEAERRLMEKPEIIFQASTPLHIMVLSVHKSFRQFVAFYREILQIADIKTVVLSLTEDITKTFTIGELDITLGKL